MYYSNFKHLKVILVLFLISKLNYSQETSYRFDLLARLTQISYSNGQVINYTYDANGNRIQETRTVNSPLPVNLIAFDLNKSGCNDLSLYWQTSGEQDNAGFVVQESVDARNYSDLGFVKGGGTAGSKNTYRYQLPGFADGQYYFRLKQMDKDGKYTYSKVLTTTLSCNSSLLSLAPNPAHDQINILGLDNSKSHTIKIFDSRGILVANKYLFNQRTVNVANLANGLYLVKIDDNQTLKFIKLK